jgi:hypothetical protein
MMAGLRKKARIIGTAFAVARKTDSVIVALTVILQSHGFYD